MPKSNKTKLAVFLLGLMGFWAMGDNYAASPMLVDIARDFSIDIGTAALSVAAYMLPWAFTLLFGPLGDRAKPRLSALRPLVRDL